MVLLEPFYMKGNLFEYKKQKSALYLTSPKDLENYKQSVIGLLDYYYVLAVIFQHLLTSFSSFHRMALKFAFEN